MQEGFENNGEPPGEPLWLVFSALYGVSTKLT